MNEFDADIIVAGGGPAGLTMTALAAAAGARVVCIDAEKPAIARTEAFDGRTTAISWGSQKVLAAAGIWDMLAPDACPIETIRIYDGDSPSLLEFDSAEADGRIFGWIVENRLLRSALQARVAALETARHIAPAKIADYRVDEEGAQAVLSDGRVYGARLIVGADGRNSFMRGWMGIGTRAWSYNQRAIVCTVMHDRPHGNVAVENFYPEGPFAVLPMMDDAKGNHRSAIVWTEHGIARRSVLNDPQDAFDAALNARFPAFYGAVRQAGPRSAWPLGLVHAHRYTGPRMALVAEAAHGIHPIAGQGLNMGLRDIALLAELTGTALAQGGDPGSPALLARYQQARRPDNMAMAGATDTLNRLFSNNIAPVRLARRAGLRLVSHMPPARRFFMKQAMGAAGMMLPALIGDKEAA